MIKRELLFLMSKYDKEQMVDIIIHQKDDLKSKIIERSLVEQYINIFVKEINNKKRYYSKLIVELDMEIKNGLILGYKKEQLVNNIIKVNEKVESVLYAINLQNKNNVTLEEVTSLHDNINLKKLISDYINIMETKLTMEEKELKAKAKDILTKLDNDTVIHLYSDEDKMKLITEAIKVLEKDKIKVGFTSISRITKRHPQTIKSYCKQLKIKF
jgi:hypothetical protein